jgi:hypothetical protein
MYLYVRSILYLTPLLPTIYKTSTPNDPAQHFLSRPAAESLFFLAEYSLFQPFFPLLFNCTIVLTLYQLSFLGKMKPSLPLFLLLSSALAAPTGVSHENDRTQSSM